MRSVAAVTVVKKIDFFTWNDTRKEGKSRFSSEFQFSFEIGFGNARKVRVILSRERVAAFLVWPDSRYDTFPRRT